MTVRTARRPSSSSTVDAATSASARPRDDELETIELQLLTEAVFRHYGLDFRNYALASLRRRVQLAMNEESVAHHLGAQRSAAARPAARWSGCSCACRST